MEIKINCLRNGINGGGASNGPATLLDGYGTYLYDLYKPSDEDVAAHPELADEPLGIAFPMGNVVFKFVKNINYTPTTFSNTSVTKMQFARAYFPPSMLREVYKNGEPTNADESIIEYLKGASPLSDSYRPNSEWGCFYFTDAKTEGMFSESIYSDSGLEYNITLSSAFSLSTAQTNLYFSGVTKFYDWNSDANGAGSDEESLKSTAFNLAAPIFCFYQPKYNSRDNMAHVYDIFSSSEELSKINEADIEYYKKSAVLIYKKDLMNFKNFCEKIMSYCNEIFVYSDNLYNSLINQQQG